MFYRESMSAFQLAGDGRRLVLCSEQPVGSTSVPEGSTSGSLDGGSNRPDDASPMIAETLHGVAKDLRRWAARYLASQSR